MIKILLKVNKGLVYNDVEKVTSYVGAKTEEAGQQGAYDLNRVVDGNREVLERFWAVACSSASTSLNHYILHDEGYHPPTHGVELADDYEIVLGLPDNFKESLKDSIESSLISYFVSFICGQWFDYMNKDEATVQIETAKGLMKDIVSMLYARKRPKRYNMY